MRKLMIGMFLASIIPQAAALATEIPSNLRCKVSGFAGCSTDGICVGAGRRDDNVRMSLDLKERQLVLNGVRGWFVDKQELRLNQSRQIGWKFGLINFERITFVLRQRGQYTATLSDFLPGVGGQQLEFHCKRR